MFKLLSFGRLAPFENMRVRGKSGVASAVPNAGIAEVESEVKRIERALVFDMNQYCLSPLYTLHLVPTGILQGSGIVRNFYRPHPIIPHCCTLSTRS